MFIAANATPATPNAAIQAMGPAWAMITALLGGTTSMREAGKLYLPKHPAESGEAYKYRVDVSTLFNGFRRTIDTLSGKPFSEPLKLGDDVPPVIETYSEDIDLEGRNLQAFAHDVMRTVLSYGLSHILVDYPTTPGAQSLAAQHVSGARPYFVHIYPWNVLDWRSERINGVETLTQLRFFEYVEEPDGDWAKKEIRQVRVLEPDNYRIYREDEKGDWVLYDEGLVSIGIIPLATAYGERTGFMTARPPLQDLAHLNVEHWQSSSDQSNILHVARVPILFASGFTEDSTIKIGAGIAVTNDDPAAKLAYVDSSMAAPAIEAGRLSIKDLEDRMSIMGAEPLAKKPGKRTATETIIDTSASDSALSLMALNLEDTLELALQFVAVWDGLPDGGTLELFKDFSGDDDQAAAEKAPNAKEMGIISAQTAFGILQRAGVVPEELDWTEELERMKAEGPTTGIIGSFEAAPGVGEAQQVVAPAGAPESA